MTHLDYTPGPPPSAGMLPGFCGAPDLTSYDAIMVMTSAGKDSVVALLEAARQCLAAGVDPRRVVAVHCALGRVEWPRCDELAIAQAALLDVPCMLVERRQGGLIEMIRERGMWPDSGNRYCTAGVKRQQGRRCATAVARVFNGRPRSGGAYVLPSDVEDRLLAMPRVTRDDEPVRILYVMGMRGAESTSRSKMPPFKVGAVASKHQQVDEWLPVHGWSVDDVWRVIYEAQVPYHWAYDEGATADFRYAFDPSPHSHTGMPRLSCMFCVFSPRAALIRAGYANPELLAELVGLEQEIGHTLKKNLSLADIALAIHNGEMVVGAIPTWEM